MDNFDKKRSGRKGFPLEHLRQVLELIVENKLAYSEIGRQMVPPCSVQHVCLVRKRAKQIHTWSKVTKSLDFIVKHTKEAPEFVSMVGEVLGLELLEGGSE